MGEKQIPSSCEEEGTSSHLISNSAIECDNLYTPHWTEWYRWTPLMTGSGHLIQRPLWHTGGSELWRRSCSTLPWPTGMVTMCLAHTVCITQESILKAWWLNDLKNKTTTPIIWLHITPIIWQALSHNLANHGYLSGKHWVTIDEEDLPKWVHSGGILVKQLMKKIRVFFSSKISFSLIFK